MPKLTDQKSAIKLLIAHGWKEGSRARHGVKMEKAGQRPVILPRMHGQPYGKGLTRAIIRQAGLEKESITWSSRSKLAQRARATGRRSKSSRGASPQLEL